MVLKDNLKLGDGKIVMADKIEKKSIVKKRSLSKSPGRQFVKNFP